MEWLLFGIFGMGALLSLANGSNSDSSPSISDNNYGTDGSSFDSSSDNFSTCSSINPANGLPMIGDSCIDIEGNPYGTDSSSWDDFESYSDDSWSSSSFDNDWDR